MSLTRHSRRPRTSTAEFAVRRIAMMKITEDFQALDEFGHTTQQAIMPIVAGKNGNYWPLGTGFMVGANGVMMTATHVLKEAYLKGTGQHPKRGALEADMELYALYITNERHGPNNENYVGGPWPIDRAWYSEELDIAFCWLRSATRNGKAITFPILKLSPGLPHVGHPIMGFGYYKMKSDTKEYSEEGIVVDYAQNTAFTKGKIVDVYPTGRDSGMLNFPVFQTDARFDHGMSGGPILNEHGSVCGVICSSMPPVEDDPRYISFGSLIWPAMGSSIDIVMEEGKGVERVQIYRLVESGYLIVDDTFDRVTVSEVKDGVIQVGIRK